MALFGPPDVEALKRAKDVGKLKKALSYKDAGIRAKAAEALGALEATDTVQALAAALDDPDEAVVKAAAIALGESGDPLALEPLLARTATSDAIYRQAFVTGRYFDRLEQNGGGAAIAVALRNRNHWVREAAANALLKHPHPEAVPDLVAALDDDEHLVRRVVVRALRAAGPDSPSVEALVRRLRDPKESSDVRKDAAAMLGDIGDPTAGPPLIEVLEGGAEGVTVSNDVLVAAAGAVAALRYRDALGALVKRLAHESHDVATAAAAALGAIKDPAALPLLIDLLHSEEPLRRSAAAAALGELGDQRAVEPLRAMLRTGDRQAVTSLERLQPGSLGLKVLASGGTFDPPVARIASLIDHLRADPDVDPIPALIDALADEAIATNPLAHVLRGYIRPSPDDRRLWVIALLGEIGDERAIPALEDCRKTDPWGQYQADSGLPELSHGAFEHPRREAAAAAIERIRSRTRG